MTPPCPEACREDRLRLNADVDNLYQLRNEAEADRFRPWMRQLLVAVLAALFVALAYISTLYHTRADASEQRTEVLEKIRQIDGRLERLGESVARIEATLEAMRRRAEPVAEPTSATVAGAP